MVDSWKRQGTEDLVLVSYVSSDVHAQSQRPSLQISNISEKVFLELTIARITHVITWVM